MGKWVIVFPFSGDVFMQQNISSTISLQQLEHAVKIAARIVALHGEGYLPIFNRLHCELAQAKEKERDKSIALQMALSYSE